MGLDEKIKRINELYHKSKTEGLTAEEKEEQASLRAEYIANIRQNLKGQLDNISIQTNLKQNKIINRDLSIYICMQRGYTV